MNIGRSIFREFERDGRRSATYVKLQTEAASRPGSTLIQTPAGPVWMSPIEAKLYEAMCREGLNPIPQFCVNGYYVDFAFPDIQMAVEADGAAYHGDIHREYDRKRDWILRNAGWTVKRFHGKTIHHKAENCAYVVMREVRTRREWVIELARQEGLRRRARKDAILRPFRWIARFLRHDR
jgi:very-short-patch-repair endonuclease